MFFVPKNLPLDLAKGEMRAVWQIGDYAAKTIQ